MKKKILFGVSLCGVAGAFWACGSGDIYKVNESDDYMDDIAEGTPAYGVKTDLLATNCPECVEAVSSSSKATPSATSSFTRPPVYSSYTSPVSSIVVNLSSSSSLGSLVSSTTVEESSSSMEIISGGTAGTCVPDPAVVNRGDGVTWKFTRNSSVFPEPKDLVPCTFNWTFEGGSKPSVEITGVLGPTIKDISYAESGKHNTTLLLKTPAGQSYSVACSPVQVNGAAITGCLCAPTNAKKNLKGNYVVDVVEAQSVEYAVSGCASVGANIVDYVWTGATGEKNTASVAVAAKDDAVQPSVMVSNDDHSEIAVQCPLVTAIDSRIPDYELTGLGKENGITFKGEDGVVAATITMNLTKDTQARKFACQVTRGAGDGRISGTVGTVKISGGDYVTSNTIPMENTIGGYQLEVLLNIGQNESVLCFITN